MTNDDLQKRAEALFFQLLERAGEERAALLESACAGDERLREEVESLLAHHEKLGSFLANPAIADLASTVEATSESFLPKSIGPYRLLERLGEGGMGEVYLAEQSSPIKRRVALKLIKAGMDSKEVIARFESERQALAMMNHPNVARIFDAGSTENGRPYFAMEHVAGEHITSYCDRHKLDLDGRLSLFIPVCQAIHHAHQKGIIHRDIKPSNVLVAMEDGKPVPKVIDFGVAKATQQSLTEKSIFTMQGVLVGTPAYMSPEQAEMTGLNVDTTSDVYSLGVLLYELLVGAQPFDAAKLREAGLAEIHRIIREVDPPKPSTKIRTMGKTATDITARRQSRPSNWQRMLTGELDWITMRAMEKDRSRRYQSAHALAEDVDRYLHHEAVTAGPPSQLYRFKKIVSRNKLGTGFIATVLLLVIGFGISMGVLRQRAEEARAVAEQRTSELEQVTEFQASMLSGVDAQELGEALYADLRERITESLGEEGVEASTIESAVAEFDETLRRANATDVALQLIDEQVLSRAVTALEAEFADQPLVRAALQETVAKTYRDIGRYPPGVPLQKAALETHRRVLGEDHLATLKSVNYMGDLYHSMGNSDEAGKYYAEALESCRRALGPDHPETLHTLTNMGDHLHSIGDVDSARVFCEESLAGHRRVLGDEHPETLVALNNLASLFITMKKFDEALPPYREAVGGMRRVLGDDHPETLNTINNLGFTLQSLGKYDEALANYREALEGRRRTLGDAHPKTLVSVGSMAYLLKSMGRLEEALVYYEETLEGRRQSLGNDHPKTLVSMSLVGTLLKSMGRLDEAAPYYREAVAGMRKTLGDDHPNTLTMQNNTAALLRSLGELDEAMRYVRSAHEGCLQKVGERHPATLQSVTIIGNLLLDQGKADESLGQMLASEPIAREVYTAKYPSRLGVFLTVLGRARTATADFSLAEANLNEAETLLNGDSDSDAAPRKEALTALVDLYEAWHAAEPAKGYETKAEEFRRILDPSSSG